MLNGLPRVTLSPWPPAVVAVLPFTNLPDMGRRGSGAVAEEVRG